MAAITICSNFGAQKNKVWHCFHVSPSICHEVMGPDAMIFVFWMLSFKPAFSLWLFKFLFTFWHKGGVICISEVIDISPGNLIPACASSSPAFLMRYSAYKLNKQGDNIQPWRTPFSIWNQSVVSCPVLTVASWPVTARWGCYCNHPVEAKSLDEGDSSGNLEKQRELRDVGHC